MSEDQTKDLLKFIEPYPPGGTGDGIMAQGNSSGVYIPKQTN